jgi:hypothetical protein
MLEGMRKKIRSKPLIKFASAHGLLYSETTGRFWELQEAGLRFLLVHENVLSGRWQGLPVTEADFELMVGRREIHPMGLGVTTELGFGLRRISALVADLPADLPALMIQRRVPGLRDEEVLYRCGADYTKPLPYRVESGPAEFNRMFQVTTDNTTFATKLIDASMINWLPSLAGPELILLHGRNLALVWGFLLSAANLTAVFNAAKSFTDHIPLQIWAEYGTR